MSFPLGESGWPRMINRGVSIRGTHAPGGQPFFVVLLYRWNLSQTVHVAHSKCSVNSG